MVSHRLPRRFNDERSGARQTVAIRTFGMDSILMPAVGSEDAARRTKGAATGFRHFLEPLEPSKTFDPKVLTPDLHEGDTRNPEPLKLYKRRISRLALAISDYRKNCLDRDKPCIHDNPRIPAGYTYFLQMIAHDLVASSIPISSDQGNLTSSRDTRDMPLRLDTLYGAGPDIAHLCYQMGASPGSPRSYLRMGPAIVKDSATLHDLVVLRDIPRRWVYPLDRVAMANPTLCISRHEAQLADARNDDNGIISQLLTVFIMLHNAVLDCINATLPELPLADPEAQLRAARIFETARAIVTLVYRRIIREDLMGRILHPDIHKLYAARGNAIVDAAAAAGDIRPVKEFSLAAFRFGHAMLRESYFFRSGDKHALTEILEQSSSSKLPVSIPPRMSWLIAWSRFFEIDTVKPPQPSRRIQPGTDLSQLVLNVLNEPAPTDGVEGLDYADMLSGGKARLWRLEPLIEALSAQTDLKALIAESSLLASADKRRFAVENWLDSFVPAKTPDDPDRAGDITALASEPPLTFFVRFEACWPGIGGGNGGTHLGILGSVLVAESFYSALSGSHMAEESAKSPVDEAVRGRLGAEAAAALTGELITPLSKVTSMPDLLRQVQLLAKPLGPDFL